MVVSQYIDLGTAVTEDDINELGRRLIGRYPGYSIVKTGGTSFAINGMQDPRTDVELKATGSVIEVKGPYKITRFLTSSEVADLLRERRVIDSGKIFNLFKEYYGRDPTHFYESLERPGIVIAQDPGARIAYDNGSKMVEMNNGAYERIEPEMFAHVGGTRITTNTQVYAFEKSPGEIPLSQLTAIFTRAFSYEGEIVTYDISDAFGKEILLTDEANCLSIHYAPALGRFRISSINPDIRIPRAEEFAQIVKTTRKEGVVRASTDGQTLEQLKGNERPGATKRQASLRRDIDIRRTVTPKDLDSLGATIVSFGYACQTIYRDERIYRKGAETVQINEFGRTIAISGPAEIVDALSGDAVVAALIEGRPLPAMAPVTSLIETRLEINVGKRLVHEDMERLGAHLVKNGWDWDGNQGGPYTFWKAGSGGPQLAVRIQGDALVLEGSRVLIDAIFEDELPVQKLHKILGIEGRETIVLELETEDPNVPHVRFLTNYLRGVRIQDTAMKDQYDLFDIPSGKQVGSIAINLMRRTLSVEARPEDLAKIRENRELIEVELRRLAGMGPYGICVLAVSGSTTAGDVQRALIRFGLTGEHEIHTDDYATTTKIGGVSLSLHIRVDSEHIVLEGPEEVVRTIRENRGEISRLLADQNTQRNLAARTANASRQPKRVERPMPKAQESKVAFKIGRKPTLADVFFVQGMYFPSLTVKEDSTGETGRFIGTDSFMPQPVSITLEEDKIHIEGDPVIVAQLIKHQSKIREELIAFGTIAVRRTDVNIIHAAREALQNAGYVIINSISTPDKAVLGIKKPPEGANTIVEIPQGQDPIVREQLDEKKAGAVAQEISRRMKAQGYQSKGIKQKPTETNIRFAGKDGTEVAISISCDGSSKIQMKRQKTRVDTNDPEFLRIETEVRNCVYATTTDATRVGEIVAEAIKAARTNAGGPVEVTIPVLGATYVGYASVLNMLYLGNGSIEYGKGYLADGCGATIASPKGRIYLIDRTEEGKIIVSGPPDAIKTLEAHKEQAGALARAWCREKSKMVECAPTEGGKTHEQTYEVVRPIGLQQYMEILEEVRAKFLRGFRKVSETRYIRDATHVELYYAVGKGLMMRTNDKTFKEFLEREVDAFLEEKRAEKVNMSIIELDRPVEDLDLAALRRIFLPEFEYEGGYSKDRKKMKTALCKNGPLQATIEAEIDGKNREIRVMANNDKLAAYIRERHASFILNLAEARTIIAKNGEINELAQKVTGGPFRLARDEWHALSARTKQQGRYGRPARNRY